jgi:hypothetical protein
VKASCENIYSAFQRAHLHKALSSRTLRQGPSRAAGIILALISAAFASIVPGCALGDEVLCVRGRRRTGLPGPCVSDGKQRRRRRVATRARGLGQVHSEIVIALHVVGIRSRASASASILNLHLDSPTCEPSGCLAQSPTGRLELGPALHQTDSEKNTSHVATANRCHRWIQSMLDQIF